MSWLDGYNHRVKIPITCTTAGAQTNYPMLLQIVKGVGTNEAGIIYLQNHALSWPNDIRFTKADGETLLDNWREEYDSTDGTWWIEIDSIAASGDTEVYIYYGKDSDSDASNADNTFLFFDDFPNAALDGNKWVSGSYNGAIAVADSILSLYVNDVNAKIYSYVATKSKFDYPFSVRYRIKGQKTSTLCVWGQTSVGPSQTTTHDSKNMYANQTNSDTPGTTVPWFSVNGTNVAAACISTSEYRTVDLKFAHQHSYSVWPGGSYANAGTIESASHYVKLSMRKWYNGQACYNLYDWVVVKKYVYPEPTWATPSEEGSPIGYLGRGVGVGIMEGVF